MNFSSVMRFLSFIMLFIALIMLVPLFMALHLGETDALKSFMLTELLMVLTSIFIINITAADKELRIGTKEAMLVVTLTWVFMAGFGALPLYLTHSLETYSACFFETMSGFTTAGATVISDVESFDRSIVFWRSLTNWLGGMGVVVLFVAVLPIFGVKGNALVGAEAVGPSKSKFTPTIRGTALILWLIYIALSALEVILLLFGGLPVFDSFAIMFGTIGAAGFSPLNSSIEGYHSAYVEWVCTIFMFLAGVNFSLYFYALKRHFSKIVRNGEFRLYVGIMLTVTFLVALQLIIRGTYPISSALRYAAFHVVSLMTTTGFVASDFNAWPMFSQMILVAVCFIGACSGSAGGGVKVVRVGVLGRLAINSMKKRFHPNAITSIKLGDESFDSNTALSIAGYFCCYIITLIIGSVIIGFTDKDFLTCVVSVFICIGNLGTGVGGLGAAFTYDAFPSWALWVFSFLMLVGRLEFYTVYTLFTRDFWAR